ncbi:unnamed protein product [Aphis gossypii]|uniref:Aminopeptidase n=1 Tax=Aphis gossypii TaxID=80765 RepID=A0A9P0JIL4_APHGO|nr:unnamed protein product [Aphis gossypii]
MWRFLLVYVFCSFTLLRQSNGQANEYRLPRTTVPENYDLRFEFQDFNDTDNLKFSGVATITIVVIENTAVVTLNLRDLNVTGVTVSDVTDDRYRLLQVEGWMYLTNDERFEIHLSRTIPMSRRLRVSINYIGNIRKDMTGLYLSSYEEQNTTKWFIVTQFEATYARRAFPCYDEPAFKAEFNISVVKQSHQIALSNMPIRHTEYSLNQTETVYFNQTPPMSTYLVAIYVGEFVPSNNPMYDSPPIMVYTHQELSDQTEYIRNEAPKHLRILEDYTRLPYMLPKMDLLAIPNLSFGAMENWGINTYQENFLLLSNESKARMKMRSSIIVQHEFTHQWFGNLVTCQWWDYVWLNEGFAQYFQYFATGMVRTSWSVEEMFVVEAFQGALAYDQTPRHPITASVNTPEEIEDVFDYISYSKAASVLRMLKYLVTEDLFQLSLQDYLNKYSQNTAEPSDLFSSFNSVLFDNEYEIGNDLTVHEFMSNWTLQSGYPVLNITRNATTNTFLVTQGQFYVNKTARNINETAAWHIGLTYTTSASKNFTYTQPSVWTNQTNASTVFWAPRDIDWYIFNIQSIGFYRVNYEVDNWMALIRQLNDTPTDIHVLNRAQLIDDSFNLARSGQLDYSVPLHLSKYLKNEDDITPWYSAMNGFAYLLERMPRSDKGYEDLKSHVRSLAGTIYSKLEYIVQSNNNTEFRVLSAWEAFSRWACRLENNNCTTKAQKYFETWQNGEKIPADIKDAAFCVGVKNSNGPSVFNNMFTLYINTKSISEKSSAELALGCSTNRTQLSEYINHMLDGRIERRYFRSVISAISTTSLGLDVLYEFLSTNLNTILNELPDGYGVATFIYSTLATKMTNDDEFEKLNDLKNNSTVPDSLRSSFEKSYEKVNENLAWFDKYADGISKWALENREPDPEITTTTESTTTTTVMSTTSPVTVNQTSTTTSIGTTEPSTDSTTPVTKYITTTTYKPSTETTHMHVDNWILVLLLFCLLLSILTLLKVCKYNNMM